MKLLTIAYLINYFLHITLGPYFLWFIFNSKKPKWISKNIKDILKKSVYITYVSFLLIAYFNENPNIENFIVASTCSLIATIGYVIKFGLKDRDEDFYLIAIFDHIIYLIIPCIYLYFHYKLDFKDYKPGLFTLFFVIFMIIYKFYDNLIYDNKGVNV